LVERILQLIPVILASPLSSLADAYYPWRSRRDDDRDQHTTPDEIAKLRAELGLDRPLHMPVLSFHGRTLTFDLGMSYNPESSVSDIILPRLPATIELSVLSMIVALLIGIPRGHCFPRSKDTLCLTKAGTFFSLLRGIPAGFWFSLLLIIFFSATLEWLPPQAYRTRL